MTLPRRHTRTPLALVGGLVVLIVVHSSIQDSTEMFSRTLPFLLMMLLGELAREWTVTRLGPTADEHEMRGRRRLQWLALSAGIACMTLSIVGAVAEWWLKRSVWTSALFATGIVGLGVSAGVMIVRSQAAMDAKRAAMLRNGQQPAQEMPGPLVFLLVFVAAIALFTTANATAIDALLLQQALNSRQWIRAIVSAVLCGGLAFVVMRKFSEFADRPFDAADSDPG